MNNQQMNGDTHEVRGPGFVMGVLTGTVIGAGLMLWLAPRSAAALRRAEDTIDTLRNRASDEYQRASTRIGEAVDHLTRTGQGVRDNVADAVARGAHEDERVATAAKSSDGH